MKPMDAAEIKTIRKSDYQVYLQKGIGYKAYKNQMESDFRNNPDEKIKEYINTNQHRMTRIEKTYQPSEKIQQQLKQLKHKTYWLILTEHWCGDAAQTLPVFQKIAKASGEMIELKLVYRDENSDLMDAYLSGESRAIPKLIQLDNHLNVTGIWGPRPTPAQKLVKELKSNPATASTYSVELHKWYAQDKQVTLESEISKLLYRASFFCPDCFN